MPGLPLGLIASTLLLAGLSIACIRRCAVCGEPLRTPAMVAIARAAVRVAFVMGQALNWRAMYAATTASDARTLYGFTFYMLTGLHSCTWSAASCHCTRAG